MDHRPPDHLDRSAATTLRHVVDAAVGPAYDTAFLRLDLLAISRVARCGCVDCALEVDRERAAILASLPRA
ncbi:hypothetical protein [Actinomycetospora termitidis]|uniref:Uncharacterized protein n=1 Tax=Actinomycetospora termitidis TaxID=3053470 RepID=A0ABT7M255_9PSEU|nr:hypothetical protein [Actinomycetospora sp. Odt1-22]MDL5154743.1 hypothetical protein [Actinomycetospora sp. Odt1-22]